MVNKTDINEDSKTEIYASDEEDSDAKDVAVQVVPHRSSNRGTRPRSLSSAF